MLPRLSYLTRMDFFLIGSTLLVLLAVVQVAASTHAADHDHRRKAQSINTHSRWFFPTIFAAMFAAMLSVG